MEKTGNFAVPLTKRKARSRAEWVKEVRSFHDSGLRIEEYAARKGLVLSRFLFWIRTLRKEVETKTKSACSARVSAGECAASSSSCSDICKDDGLAQRR
jgi:hypothetical protein